MRISLQRDRNIKPHPTVTISHLVPSVKKPLGPEGQAVNNARLGLDSSFQKGESLQEAVIPHEGGRGRCPFRLSEQKSLQLSQRRKELVSCLARPAASHFPGLLETHPGKRLAMLRG